jgi:putative oxidoreductase
MERFLGRYEPYIYAILRIVTGFVFLWHGTQKLFNYPAMPTQPGKASEPLNAMMATAGTIELICGILIMVGLFTGFAAFLASGLMAVAYFMAHAPQGFLPIQNRGELAVLYCFLFLYLAARGSGVWSLDSLVFRGRSPARAVQ